MLNDLEIKDLQELCKENRKNIIKMVSISILLYGQLLQVIGYIERWWNCNDYNKEASLNTSIRCENCNIYMNYDRILKKN